MRVVTVSVFCLKRCVESSENGTRHLIISIMINIQDAPKDFCLTNKINILNCRKTDEVEKKTNIQKFPQCLRDYVRGKYSASS